MYSVSWQDAADLYVAVSVTYVDSGKKEISKYVTTVILPQLNALVSEVEDDKQIVSENKDIVITKAGQVTVDKNEVKNYRDEIVGCLDNYYTKSDIDTALTNYQTKANLVTSISSASSDTQYPSAKCMYDLLGDVETLINAL